MLVDRWYAMVSCMAYRHGAAKNVPDQNNLQCLLMLVTIKAGLKKSHQVLTRSTIEEVTTYFYYLLLFLLATEHMYSFE